MAFITMHLNAWLRVDLDCWTAFPTVSFSVCCWLAWATQILKPGLKNARTTAASLSFTHTVTDPQVPLIARIIAQACNSAFPWGSSLSFSSSWTIVCNSTPWEGPPVLQKSHPTKVRGDKNLLENSSSSWGPLHFPESQLALSLLPYTFRAIFSS